MDTLRERREDPVVRQYTTLAAGWHAQLRAYARSTRLYQSAIRRQVERRRRGVRDWEPVPSMVVGLPPAPAPAIRPPLDEPAPAVETPNRWPGQAENGPSPSVLTRRQLEVAGLIAEGLTNEQIARRLVLTPGTVGNHIEHILRRLGMKNRAQVAAWLSRRSAQDAESLARTPNDIALAGPASCG